MTDSPIRNVADTAFWVATFRAREGQRPDALFHDPLAARLVAGRGEQITDAMPSGGMVGWSVILRTVVIDDFVHTALKNGCDCVINLGAGLDTRPYRMDLPKSLTWIEVDFPDTIAFKEKTLASEPARCVLERVSMDLGDEAKRNAFLRECNARFQKILVLTEGVIIYLDNADVASLAAGLQAQPHVAWWIMEHMLVDFGTLSARAPHRNRMQNAPFKFKPADWSAFFAPFGWVAAERRSLVAEARRLGRRPPVPWWSIFFFLLSSRKKRNLMINGYAYALMKRSG